MKEIAESTPVAVAEEPVLSLGKQVMLKEAAAIEQAAAQLGPAFVAAVKALLQCRGRVCVTGIGKAGLVGRKIQATLASTGTPSYSLHPVEALHGDLGMVDPQDVVIALSKSGGSEVTQLIPILKKLGCVIILITADANSAAAQHADHILSIGTAAEACPLGLAPSASTTAMLAIGDALALTVMKQKAIRPEDYAFYHPGGALGRALMRVKDIMRTGANCPTVGPDASLAACYQAMLGAPLRAGAAIVVSADGTLEGILTQGDVLRSIAGRNYSSERRVAELMTKQPKRIGSEQPVLDALTLMREYSIDELPVVNNQDRVLGLLDIQDLIRHGFPIGESVG